MFLGQHTGKPRHTQDIDLTIVDENLYFNFRKLLAEFGEKLISTGDIVSYEIKEDIFYNQSGGAKYRDVTNRVVLSIDISWSVTELDNVLVDTEEFGTIRISSVEQILSDKLAVLFSRKRFRRSKDLYDTWLILKTCSIKEERLIKCLQERSIYSLPVDKAPFREDCYLQIEHAYNKLLITDAKIELLMEKPSFEEVVKVVGNFVMKFMVR